MRNLLMLLIRIVAISSQHLPNCAFIFLPVHGMGTPSSSCLGYCKIQLSHGHKNAHTAGRILNDPVRTQSLYASIILADNDFIVYYDLEGRLTTFIHSGENPLF